LSGKASEGMWSALWLTIPGRGNSTCKGWRSAGRSQTWERNLSVWQNIACMQERGGWGREERCLC
jgi:hypothetical protein